jgi:hypothetical protein
MVEVDAIIAQAASTALPPFWNIIAPVVAARGLPVIATQWRPWRTGLAVRWAKTVTESIREKRTVTVRGSNEFIMISPYGAGDVFGDIEVSSIDELRFARLRIANRPTKPSLTVGLLTRLRLS